MKNSEFGGFLVTNSVLKGISRPMYTFREEMNNKELNGWHIMGDSDDEDYINDASNCK